jgi:hypothetical protein
MSTVLVCNRCLQCDILPIKSKPAGNLVCFPFRAADNGFSPPLCFVEMPLNALSVNRSVQVKPAATEQRKQNHHV